MRHQSTKRRSTMPENRIDILVTFDKNYINPFKTMLKSLVANNPREDIYVWLLHSSIPKNDLQVLTSL